jgi:hypothetical protein
MGRIFLDEAAADDHAVGVNLVFIRACPIIAQHRS